MTHTTAPIRHRAGGSTRSAVATPIVLLACAAFCCGSDESGNSSNRPVLQGPHLAASATETGTADTAFCKIVVVDEQTQRGVPLVELKTTNNIRYYTDSNGIVAFHEPGLMNRDVFFSIASHGYEFPADGFGMRGRAVRIEPGGEVRLEIKRINIAERLYRITGGGIYRDSLLTGHPVPIRQPVINGDVLGQDSIQTALYRDRIFWFWGDTNWPKYPLGNFHMAGATSRLPSEGGLDPDLGVNLEYFVRENGFAKEMAPRPEPGPVWLDSLVTLPDDTGRERLLAAYARVNQSMKAVERGFMKYNDEKEIFEKVHDFPLDAPVRAGGHPFKHASGGTDYIWFPHPFPLVRVRAETGAYLDLQQYMAWTPLKEGRTPEDPVIDRDASGAVRYAWRKGTPPLDQKHQNDLVKAGQLKPGECWIQLQDIDTGKPITAHAGSVYWNDYRHRWITIRCEVMGTSMLGEIWYAEADTPIGPWVYARKIVTHDRYDLYNPEHHPFFDKDGGRIIYFEGTYVNTFSGNPDKTPRYNYNQIMYKLDLADPRLALPVPVYRQPADRADSPLSVGHRPRKAGRPREIAFFGLDRTIDGAVPVYHVSDRASGLRLVAGDRPSGAPENAEPLFHALPADGTNPPATTLPLHEFVADDGLHRAYSTDPQWSSPGYRKADTPVCRVWRNPLTVNLPAD